MNFEEALRDAALALRSGYDNYDLQVAEQHLEDRIIAAEVSTMTHPSVDMPADDGDEQPQDWRRQAQCRDEDSDGLFVRGKAQRTAKLVCVACPVRTECLAEALDNRIEYGVWGWMTERERRALLRRRPDVESWRDVLETARRGHDHVSAETWEDIIAG